MVTRINRNVARKTDARIKAAPPRNSDDSRVSPLRNHNSNDDPMIDDVIAALANAHENRRARQVVEWERLRSPTYQMAA